MVDCPVSHIEIEKALFRLRETAIAMNCATNNDHFQQKIQKSWLLHDMLIFPDSVYISQDCAARELAKYFKQEKMPFMIRSLGHVTLCGALFIAYQSKRTVVGEYMLCALFKSYLVLAIPSEAANVSQAFEIIAAISLIDLHLECTDNGKGPRVMKRHHKFR